MVRDITWLADPAREGRGVGTAGLLASGEYIEERFKSLGLEPLSPNGSYRQELEVVTRVKAGSTTALGVGGAALAADQFQPLGFSAQGTVAGSLMP